MDHTNNKDSDIVLQLVAHRRALGGILDMLDNHSLDTDQWVALELEVVVLLAVATADQHQEA